MKKTKPTTQVGTVLRSCYRQGQQYLKSLQATNRPWRCDLCRTCLKEAVRLLALSKIDTGFRIADALAEEYGISRKQVREHCHFAAAVDTIAVYCGDEARELILQGHKYLGHKTVLQISRTAPARQRYEINQVRQGIRPLITNGKGCPVYDTVDFKEVLSRLRRAQGKVGVCLAALDRLAETRPTHQEASVIRARLDDIRADVRNVMRVVRFSPEGQPCPCDLARMAKPRQQFNKVGPRDSPSSFHGMLGLLNQARSWTSKCVRDLPHLLQEVLPLRKEKEQVQLLGRLVLKEVETLLEQRE